MTPVEKLEAATAKAKAANDALEAAIKADPNLMHYARLLLRVANVAAPLVAGAVGGPGAAAIASIAVRLASEAAEG